MGVKVEYTPGNTNTGEPISLKESRRRYKTIPSMTKIEFDFQTWLRHQFDGYQNSKDGKFAEMHDKESAIALVFEHAAKIGIIKACDLLEHEVEVLLFLDDTQELEPQRITVTEFKRLITSLKAVK